MTIRSRRRSFAPSSIGRSFRSGSAHSNTRAPSATTSWLRYNDAHHHSGLSYRHAGRRALRPRAGDSRPASPHPPRGLRRASGAIRQRTTTPRNLADRRMDQSAVRNDSPGCPRTDDRHRGRLPACGRCPAATAARSVVVAPRRWRGVATVNAELGCLKDVDTARYSPSDRLCSYVSTGSMGQVTLQR